MSKKGLIKWREFVDISDYFIYTVFIIYLLAKSTSMFTGVFSPSYRIGITMVLHPTPDYIQSTGLNYIFHHLRWLKRDIQTSSTPPNYHEGLRPITKRALGPITHCWDDFSVTRAASGGSLGVGGNDRGAVLSAAQLQPTPSSMATGKL
jgi:hypothetical protein